MEEGPTREAPPQRRVDAVTALMVALTLLSLAGAVWLRYGPERARPDQAGREADGGAAVAVGAPAPRLRLLDASTSEPVLLIGLKGRVVWLVFWSSRSTTGAACLTELTPTAHALQSHRMFVLATAAVERDGDAALRVAKAAAEAASGPPVPIYLATPEARRLFRTGPAVPPLHVLINARGTVVTIERHVGRATIDRIAEQARHELETLDPLGNVRFAARRERRPRRQKNVLRKPWARRAKRRRPWPPAWARDRSSNVLA